MRSTQRDRIAGSLTSLVFILVPVLMSVSATLVSAAKSDDDLQSLIDLHLTWLGGASAWQQMETLELHGVLRVSGLEGPIDLLLQREPAVLRFSYDLGVVTGLEVIGPDDSWVQNPSGQIEAMGENSEMNQRRQIAGAFQLPLLSGEGVVRSYPGSEEKDGMRYEVLRLTFPNGDTSDILVDPKDGSTQWARNTVDLRTHWAESVAWKTFEGVRIAVQTREIHENPAENVEISWTDVVPNPEFSADLWERPTVEAKGGFADGAKTTGWMDMELMGGRWIYLRGTVAGFETDIVLDSGAGITVIDQSFADRIGLQGAGSIPAQGTGGTREASLVQGVEIRIGTTRLPNLTAAIIDLDEVRQMLGRDMPVILGKEMFHQFVVDIDYPNERIAFHDPASYVYDGQGKRVDLIPADGGHKGLLVSVEGHPEVMIKLDTGSGGTLTIFETYSREVGLLEGRERMSDYLTGGVGGTTVSKRGSLSRLSIAGFELENVPVGFHTGDRGAFHTNQAAGNLGSRILRRFRNTYDYSREQLFLEPSEDWDRAFAKDRVGASLQRRGEGIEIVHVGTGSPAEASGLKIGDCIVEVDGERLEQEFRRAWSTATERPAGTVMFVRDANGKETKIVLRDFF